MSSNRLSGPGTIAIIPRLYAEYAAYFINAEGCFPLAWFTVSAHYDRPLPSRSTRGAGAILPGLIILLRSHQLCRQLRTRAREIEGVKILAEERAKSLAEPLIRYSVRSPQRSNRP